MNIVCNEQEGTYTFRAVDEEDARILELVRTSLQPGETPHYCGRGRDPDRDGEGPR